MSKNHKLWKYSNAYRLRVYDEKKEKERKELGLKEYNIHRNCQLQNDAPLLSVEHFRLMKRFGKSISNLIKDNRMSLRSIQTIHKNWWYEEEFSYINTTIYEVWTEISFTVWAKDFDEANAIVSSRYGDVVDYDDKKYSDLCFVDFNCMDYNEEFHKDAILEEVK